MIRSTAFLSSLLFASTMTVVAQQPSRVDIHGVVVDQTSGAPIRAAAVRHNGKKWAVITDENGRFALPGVPLGAVIVEVEQLGYGRYSKVHEVLASPPFLRIELTPDPIVLKGVQVTADRLRSRRNAVAVSVRAYTADQLSQTAAFDAYDFLRARLSTRPCPTNRIFFSTTCIIRRGGVISPAVYVDDAPFVGGLDVAQGWPLSDIYLIEVYSSGAQIRIYTKRFAQLLATGRVRLSPILY